MSSITLKRVKTAEDLGEEAIAVTLFKDEDDRVCGWFIGPLRIDQGRIDMDYLPASERTIASVAVVRAIEAARHADLPLCIVDPADLWSDAWQG